LRGHNNDAGAFKSTLLADFLIQNKVRLLADNGYKHLQLTTPNPALPLNKLITDLRSVIETTFAIVKAFRFARMRCTIRSLQLHAAGLHCCYELVAMKQLEKPLRLSALSNTQEVPGTSNPKFCSLKVLRQQQEDQFRTEIETDEKKLQEFLTRLPPNVAEGLKECLKT